MENEEIKKAIQYFSNKAPKYNGKPCKKGCNCLEIAEHKALGGVKEYPCLDNSKHLEALKPLGSVENQQTPEGKTAEQICNENPYSDDHHFPEAYACVIADMYSEQYKSKLSHHQEANAKFVEENKDLEARLKEACELISRIKNDFEKSNWTEQTYTSIDSFLTKEKTK